LITRSVGIFTEIALPLAICFGFLFFGGFDGGCVEQFCILLRIESYSLFAVQVVQRVEPLTSNLTRTLPFACGTISVIVPVAFDFWLV
jgi:hypothetical protein